MVQDETGICLDAEVAGFSGFFPKFIEKYGRTNGEGQSLSQTRTKSMDGQNASI
jgi:hypothetical protein